VEKKRKSKKTYIFRQVIRIRKQLAKRHISLVDQRQAVRRQKIAEPPRLRGREPVVLPRRLDLLDTTPGRCRLGTGLVRLVPLFGAVVAGAGAFPIVYGRGAAVGPVPAQLGRSQRLGLGLRLVVVTLVDGALFGCGFEGGWAVRG
jgi:hypothetical protein